MSSAQTLIDTAAKNFASKRKLAEALNEDQAYLSRIERGKMPMNPRLAARLAALAGMDPRECALAAAAAQEEDDAKRSELLALWSVPDWRKR